MTLAIIDDLGAIIIIALFYSTDLSLGSLLVAMAAVTGLIWLSLKGVLRIAPYMIIGLVLWVSVLKSGVHATLAGVILGLFMPLGSRDAPQQGHSPLQELLHALHPWVAFGVLPMFAFVNAGVSLETITLRTLLDPVPLGIILGLVVGKQLGIFGFTWITIRSGIARLPKGASMIDIYGTALLCGVGFTMSLFIGSLAYEEGGAGYARPDRLGIIIGSLISGLLGFVVLRLSRRRHQTSVEDAG
jgi:NhaA family Na+:H+ antiporter